MFCRFCVILWSNSIETYISTVSMVTSFKLYFHSFISLFSRSSFMFSFLLYFLESLVRICVPRSCSLYVCVSFAHSQLFMISTVYLRRSNTACDHRITKRNPVRENSRKLTSKWPFEFWLKVFRRSTTKHGWLVPDDWSWAMTIWCVIDVRSLWVDDMSVWTTLFRRRWCVRGAR